MERVCATLPSPTVRPPVSSRLAHRARFGRFLASFAIVFGVVAGAGPLAGAAVKAPTGAKAVPHLDPNPVDISETILSGGLTRTYLIHTPPGLGSSEKVPLLLVFHGNGGTAAGIAAITGFDHIADQNSFIVVYPQGVADSWNDGRGTAEAELEGVDDVAFVHTLVLALEATLPINAHRVYATGFSNGAMLAERLGCELSSTFAAIAPVSGPLATPIAPTCAPTRPLSVLDIEGTGDAVVPFGGGIVNSAVGGSVLSASADVAFWAQHDQCVAHRSLGTRPAAPNDGSGVTVTGYGPCLRGTQVVLMSVLGGQHQWPGGLSGPGASVGNVVGASFRASPVIWRFLRKFVRYNPS